MKLVVVSAGARDPRVCFEAPVACLNLPPSPTRTSDTAMIQDDIPAPACTGEEVSAPESAPTLPPAAANSSPNMSLDACAPDPFVVGVRVLRMAPVWLLA